MIKRYFDTDSVNPYLFQLSSYGLMDEDNPYHKVLQNYIENDVKRTNKNIEFIKKMVNERFGVPKDMTIEKVIFNNPATIVIWADGTKTVVKAENEVFDPEKGLAMAISKKFFGNKGNYFDVFKKWIPELKMRDLLGDIYFEEAYKDEKSNTLALYFVAPRDLLGEKYKDAESTEICLEMENDNFDVENVSVMFSPTKDGSDYDWFSVTIPDDIIENLIDIYKSETKCQE